MGWRKNFNAWLTRKLGWYGAFMATAVCLVILTCGIAALALQTGPRELFVPGLLAIVMFAAAGPFFWVANREPGRIHIRPALAGMAIVMLCGPLTLFYLFSPASGAYWSGDIPWIRGDHRRRCAFRHGHRLLHDSLPTQGQEGTRLEVCQFLALRFCYSCDIIRAESWAGSYSGEWRATRKLRTAWRGGATIILPGEAEAGTAGMQPC